MNVAYIISMPHGVDRWTYREIEALSEEDVHVSLFPVRYHSGPYMPPDTWDVYRFNRPAVIARQVRHLARMPAQYMDLLREAIRQRVVIDFLLGMDFARAMTARRIDRIHCVFGDHKLFTGYFCHRVLNIPLSVALYGYDLRANPNWPMFQRATRACADIVANCDFNARRVIEIVGDDIANRVRVIRHFADPPVNHHTPTVKILIVGGLQPRKGHDLLLKAVRDLGAWADCAEVWVAGYRGPVDVARMAQEFGIADRVRVFGEVSDTVLDALFETCDIFCLPSRTDAQGISEGLPVALIEAMSYGKPVIATRLAGIPELVPEMLIEENSVANLADALRELITRPDLRHQQGARNRRIIDDLYSRRNVLAMRDLLLGANAS